MRRAVESLPDIGTNSMVQPVNRTVHVCGPYSPAAGLYGPKEYLIFRDILKPDKKAVFYL